MMNCFVFRYKIHVCICKHQWRSIRRTEGDGATFFKLFFLFLCNIITCNNINTLFTQIDFLYDIDRGYHNYKLGIRKKGMLGTVLQAKLSRKIHILNLRTC